MAFSVPALPYPFDALEPTIDAKTMEIHHDKHHQAYVDNANKALAETEWADSPVEDVLAALKAGEVPEDLRAAVQNNAGGHANHSLFWEIMGPNGGGEPTGALADAIARRLRGLRRLQGEGHAERRDAVRLGLVVARLERVGPGGVLDREPGFAVAAGPRSPARHRRLGARLLPELPEQAPGLPRGVVGRRELGRRRSTPGTARS